MSNCKKFSVLAVDYIVPNDNGVIVVGSQITSAARTDNVTWTHYTATGNVSATALVGGGIDNTGAAGDIVLTLPSAAAVIAALAEIGVTASAGMSFSVWLATNANHTVTVTASASITFENAATTVETAGQRSATFLFRVASVVSGAESIVVDYIVSDLPR